MGEESSSRLRTTMVIPWGTIIIANRLPRCATRFRWLHGVAFQPTRSSSSRRRWQSGAVSFGGNLRIISRAAFCALVHPVRPSLVH